MSRKSIVLSFALLLVLQLAPLSASACAKGANTEVDRKCEATETGIRCTMTATGEMTAEAVRERVRSMAPNHLQTEGVELKFEEIEGGIVVVATASDPEIIEQLQAKTAGCAKGPAEGCAKGAHHKAAKAEGCAKGAHHQAAKAEGCAKGAKSEDCAKCPHHQGADAADCAKGAHHGAATEGGCAKGAHAQKKDGSCCSKTAAKDCPSKDQTTEKAG